MNDSVKRLKALMLAQQEKLKELERENRDLTTRIRLLENHIHKLEETRMAIDFATADIPVDLNLIPEDAEGHSDR